MRGYHSIADIVFTDDESTLICTCGWDLTSTDQESMNQTYQDHRVASGEVRRSSTDLTGVGFNNEFFNAQSGSVKTAKKRVTIG